MNLTKIIRVAAVFIAVALGFASPSYAQVSSVYFSANSTCAPGTNTMPFVPGGSVITLSLCMTSTVATCGHSTILKTDVAGNNLFVVNGYSPGPNYPDKNSDFTLTPLTLKNVPGPTPSDLGSTTSSGSTPASTNQLLATFTLAALTGATNSSYVLSLSDTSIVAVVKNGDLTCGQTDVPDEFGMNSVATPATFTLTRNATPTFTSASGVTFQNGVLNSFTPVAVGIPVPTVTMAPTSGAFPAGVNFTAGVLTGTPTANGTYNLVFRASSSAVGSPTDQPFTLVVSGQASQAITFANPGAQQFSSSPITLSAIGGASGNPVVFTSGNTLVCTVLGTTLTFNTATTIQTGDCIINANQAGNANFTAAQTVTRSFGITGSVPGVPTSVSATNGNTQATILFSPPSLTGGSAITSYRASCNGAAGSATGTGTTSPITVTGLTNGQLYSCTVAATNALGTGLDSAPVSVTPTGAPLALVGVQSRKTHGTAGIFNLDIVTGVPIGGGVTVEPRGALVASQADHTIVFQFNGPVSAGTPGTATSVDALSAPVGTVGTVTAVGNEVIVQLTGVPNQRRATITLTGATGPSGTANGLVSMGFLNGDVAAPFGDTSALGDIIAVKVGGKTGIANGTNFLTDINVDGTIGLGDILAAKIRNGKSLP